MFMPRKWDSVCVCVRVCVRVHTHVMCGWFAEGEKEGREF